MLKDFKCDSTCLGKYVTYTDRYEREHRNRIIGFNAKKNYLLVMGDMPTDYPIRVFPKYATNIEGETSKIVNPVSPEFRNKQGYENFNF